MKIDELIAKRDALIAQQHENTIKDVILVINKYKCVATDFSKVTLLDDIIKDIVNMQQRKPEEKPLI